MTSPSKSTLAKIHIAKKELGLSDETYRDIIFLHFGVDSAARLTDRQAAVLLNKFRAKGWKPKRAKTNGLPGYAYGDTIPSQTAGSGHVPVTPMARKILAIWITLANAGVVRDGSDKALRKYVRRMTGKDDLRWCDGQDLWRLIEALKDWAAREGVPNG